MIGPLLISSCFPLRYFGSIGTAGAVTDFLYNMPLASDYFFLAPTYYVPSLWRYSLADYTWGAFSAWEAAIHAEYWANMSRIWRDTQWRLPLIASAPPFLA